MPTQKLWFMILILLSAVAAACSTAEPLDLADFPPDGVLDCTSDEEWGIQGTPDPNAEGFATASEALADGLAPFMEEHSDLRGPQPIRDATASLLDAQNREVVILSASLASPDNWFVTTLRGCSGFEQF